MFSFQFASTLFCLLSLSWLPSAAAYAPMPAVTPLAPVPQSDDPAYMAGTKAMNESRWSDAVGSFDQVIQSRSHRADAALYWKAYALNKLGKPDLANATCVQLDTQFRGSSWNRDCSALKLSQFSVRVRTQTETHAQTTTSPVADLSEDPSTPRTSTPTHGMAEAHTSSHTRDADADIKMLALNSLLHRDPAQAVPILRNLLTGDQSPDFKHHALFVLAQSRSPEAEAAMRDLLTGKMGPELQRSAIQAAGVYEGRRLNDSLVEVYKSTADLKVKQAVISAFFVSNDDAHLVELARAERNLELKRAIVSQLSLMNGRAATDYMMELLK